MSCVSWLLCMSLLIEWIRFLMLMISIGLLFLSSVLVVMFWILCRWLLSGCMMSICLLRKWLIVMLYSLGLLLMIMIVVLVCVMLGLFVLSSWCVVMRFVCWLLNGKCGCFLSMLMLLCVSLSVWCMCVSGNVYGLLLILMSRLWIIDSVSGNCSMKCMLVFGLLKICIVLCMLCIIFCIVLRLMLCFDMLVIVLCIEKFGSSRNLSSLGLDSCVVVLLLVRCWCMMVVCSVFMLMFGLLLIMLMSSELVL